MTRAQSRPGQLRTAWHILDTPSVTPAIVRHYAPKGKWPAWKDYNPRFNQPTRIRTGRTLDDRVESYRLACRKTGRVLATELTQDGVVLKSQSGHARFIESEDVQLDTLRADHDKALRYWRLVASEMSSGLYVKLV